jgi:endonuclease YncB( thermonuclease family)
MANETNPWPPVAGYPVVVLDVHDGDTFRARLDLGFRVGVEIDVRIAAINAPELNAAGGPEAREFLIGLLTTTPEIHVRSLRAERSFARWVCTVTADGVDVGESMIDAGQAVRWPHG